MCVCAINNEYHIKLHKSFIKCVRAAIFVYFCFNYLVAYKH